VLDAESLIVSGEEKLWIENLVRSHIIENWESQDEPEHLRTIRDRILRVGERTAQLLRLYKQIVQYGEVVADDTPERMELRLSGLVVKQLGKLKVYNNIYAAVFDDNWVDKELANLRPYAEALAAWLASHRQNESHLLQGQALKDAKRWAETKSLSVEDDQFLKASQNLEDRKIQEQEQKIQEAFEQRSATSHFYSAASSYPYALEPREITIDISVQSESPQFEAFKSRATTKGTFAAFIAPLSKDTFKEVLMEVEGRLEVVNQTLSMLDSLLDAQEFDSILDERLRSITAKMGELLAADRTSIFILDEERNQLWSIVAENQGGGSLEIRIPADQGSIAAEVATTKQVINIPYDLFDDPRSARAKEQYQRTGYRTYTMLAMPLLNEEGDLVAVVQLLNKLKLPYNPNAPLEEKIDLYGFRAEDKRVFEEFAPSIRLIMESSRSLRRTTQKQQAAQALIAATNSLKQSGLDLEKTLETLMSEAMQLMSADRSILWLIDRERDELWTKISLNGVLQEIRRPLSMSSFEGQVAVTGEALNIGFDLYDQEGSETSKKTDCRTGYRTCSLLCMPVFNADDELIGVTQLVNKKKPGEFPPYKADDWPCPPESWKASFDRLDQEFMKAFNIQAGVALENAQLFATVKQQEQRQRNILSGISSGIILTDKFGLITTFNEGARILLGLSIQDTLEGISVYEVVQIKEKEGNFSKWFETALEATDPRSRKQYYPDQTLISAKAEQRSINLSINTIADANDITKVQGVVIVMDDISNEKRLKSMMYGYMSQELAEDLLKDGENVNLAGNHQEVSILFCDIPNYAALTENLEPEEVVAMLNEYFESMTEVIFRYKGTLDKYIGDAMMAVFGSPLPLTDHAWRAVQTSIEMRHRLREFNARRIGVQKEPIRIGIGINSGTVISGNIGSSKRMQFTVIGDGVDLASIVQDTSKTYGCDIVISESTFQPCSDRIWYRELDWIRVKGKNDPVRIYEVVGLRSEPISQENQEIIEIYHKGREYYLNRKFTRAMSEFGTILEDFNKDDKAATLHLKRCQDFFREPPPDDWDGVWTFTEK
jgi:adenylate cyclase